MLYEASGDELSAAWTLYNDEKRPSKQLVHWVTELRYGRTLQEAKPQAEKFLDLARKAGQILLDNGVENRLQKFSDYINGLRDKPGEAWLLSLHQFESPTIPPVLPQVVQLFSELYRKEVIVDLWSTSAIFCQRVLFDGLVTVEREESEDLKVLQLLFRWEDIFLNIKDTEGDIDFSNLSLSELWRLSVKIMRWADQHGIESGIFHRVYEQIAACKENTNKFQGIEKLRAICDEADLLRFRLQNMIRESIFREPAEKSEIQKKQIEQVQTEAGRQVQAFAHSDSAELTSRSRALVLRKEHPDWTHIQIAKQTGCNRTSLYRWPEYMQLSKSLRQGNQPPRGSKDANTGTIEAIDDD